MFVILGNELRLFKSFIVICYLLVTLEILLKKYEYNVDALIYFKCDGHSFVNGTRLIYYDLSVRNLVALSKPHGIIDLFVDHF